MRKIQPLPIILIVINVLVYFYEVYDPNVVALGAVNFESAITNGQFYRLFTSMFLHGGIEHLAFNMLSLYFMFSILFPK